MGESSSIEFDNWLKDTLVNLNTDDEIFSPYIKGILDTDDSTEEKIEALEGIISEITESNIEQLCKEILHKWSLGSSAQPKKPTQSTESSSIDKRLSQLLEKQASCLPVATQAPATREQVALKKAILAQYAQVSGDEGDDDAADGRGAVGGLMKNNNAAVVDQEVKQKREQNKLDHKLKKEKDKEEREKQKAKAEERKDKEKKRTAKGERRR
uniref:Coiled-coil domain-containing protein 43 n=1 Tax=Hirondellea gigas TaxID=1518452 RepID=A0A2P2HZE3_9CRUS